MVSELSLSEPCLPAHVMSMLICFLRMMLCAPAVCACPLQYESAMQRFLLRRSVRGR